MMYVLLNHAVIAVYEFRTSILGTNDIGGAETCARGLDAELAPQARLCANHICSRPLRTRVTCKLDLEEIRISYIFEMSRPVPDDAVLRRMMTDAGYEFSPDQLISAPLQPETFLSIAQKGDVRFMYQKGTDPSHIGVAGPDAQHVEAEFGRLTGVLDSIDPAIAGSNSVIEVEMEYGTSDESVRPFESVSSFGGRLGQRISIGAANPHALREISVETYAGSGVGIHIAPWPQDPSSFHIAQVHSFPPPENSFRSSERGDPMYKDPAHFYVRFDVSADSLEELPRSMELHKNYASELISALSAVYSSSERIHAYA